MHYSRKIQEGQSKKEWPKANGFNVPLAGRSGSKRCLGPDLTGGALGKPLLAFVFVTDAKPSLGFDTAAALSGVTGLEELHKIEGDDCYLLKIRASGTDELNDIIETQINPVQSVTRVRTTIVLSDVTELP